MKKIVLFFVILAGMTSLRAQNTITNSDFELWSYGKPVNWTVALHGNITSFVNLPVEVNFGSKSTDAHSGTAAVKLQSADFSIPYTQYNFNIPGILQAGESEGFSIPLEDIMAIIQAMQDTTGGGFDPSNLSSLASLAKILAPGVPCTVTPSSVSAWVKYQPQEGDQMMMVAMTKLNGTPVSYAYEMFNPANPDAYEQIAVNFNEAGAECDSIMIIILSSMQMGSSSVLCVDDVSLNYSGVSISLWGKHDGEIYPIPASDRLHIRPASDNTYRWTLTDLTGKTLQSGEATGETDIDTKSFSSGIYLLQIDEGGDHSVTKVVIR